MLFRSTDVPRIMFLVFFIPVAAYFVPVASYHIWRSRLISRRDSAIFKSDVLLPVLKRRLASQDSQGDNVPDVLTSLEASILLYAA